MIINNEISTLNFSLYFNFMLKDLNFISFSLKIDFFFVCFVLNDKITLIILWHISTIAYTQLYLLFHRLVRFFHPFEEK